MSFLPSPGILYFGTGLDWTSKTRTSFFFFFRFFSAFVNRIKRNGNRLLQKTSFIRRRQRKTTDVGPRLKILQVRVLPSQRFTSTRFTSPRFTSAFQSSPVCEIQYAFSPSSSTWSDLDSSKIVSGKLPFDYILFSFFLLPPIRVLILGHSFIRPVHDFLRRNFQLNFNTHTAENLSSDGDLLIRWHGIGGRTVSKTREYDLCVVEEFAPNVVIMQLGTNDLTTKSAVETGSQLKICDVCFMSHMELK